MSDFVDQDVEGGEVGKCKDCIGGSGAERTSDEDSKFSMYGC